MGKQSLNMFIKDNTFFFFFWEKKKSAHKYFFQAHLNTPPHSTPQPSPVNWWEETGRERETLTGDKPETHAWLDRLCLWWLLASVPPEAKLPACWCAVNSLWKGMLVWRMTHYYPLISVSACGASNWNILNRCKNTCVPGRASCAALCFIYLWYEP